ncbi:MAG: metabolite traffic protein EboE [Verrucomicrobiota bacterium]
MRISKWHHLAYCTNVHPAESWEETKGVLETEVLKVRDGLREKGHLKGEFAIGLRLSARAARELLEGEELKRFQRWLEENGCYVFTINGFPYGDFHGTRVKENVYRPDWTTRERLDYTLDLFEIISVLAPVDGGGSVSTLPGSFKEFEADEEAMIQNLEICAYRIEELAEATGKDLHLGLEPEPLGHFENTRETLEFFGRMFAACEDEELMRRRVGVNYDCCHFAIEFDECRESLEKFREAGIRISKVHLSSALEFEAGSETELRQFEEPTYLHQVILEKGGELKRWRDVPDFLKSGESGRGRCHFHVPLYAEAAEPLGTTQEHVQEMLDYCMERPEFCGHFEIETYTWGVLPEGLQTDLTEMIVKEYEWVFEH